MSKYEPKPEVKQGTHTVVGVDTDPTLAALPTDPTKHDSIAYATGNRPLNPETAFPELTTAAPAVVGGGTSYRVLHTQVGDFRQGDVGVFADTDVERLLNVGAIEKVSE